MGISCAYMCLMELVTQHFVLIIALALALFYLTRKTREDKLFSKIPGPKGIPIFGNALQFCYSHKESKLLIERLYTQFYKHGLFKISLGHTKHVIVFGLKGVETVLNSPELVDKSTLYRFIKPWLGNGLLTSGGEKWHSRRKILAPTFHYKILEKYVEVFNKQSLKLLSKLQENKNEIIDVFPMVTHCALDIVTEAALKFPLNSQDNSELEYVKAITRMGYLFMTRCRQPWLHPEFIYNLSGLGREQKNLVNVLHNQSRSIIDEQKKLNANTITESDEDNIGQKKKLAFIDLLLSCTEKGKPLSDKDLQEEVDTFMFAGHDTTSIAVTICIFLMGCFHEKQKVLHDELDEIFGDDERVCTLDDIRQMKYLECCIKETLRLYPPVPIFGRHAKQDVVIEGHVVPKDTTVFILLQTLHRNGNYFPQPEEFIPERFEDSELQKKYPLSYLPFSAGPRNCIGQKFALLEAKVVLSTVFRRFRVQSVKEFKDFEVIEEVVLRPVGSVDVKFFPRK